jgi:outer membrane protein assembly factor BamD (BamD/ComL family)
MKNSCEARAKECKNAEAWFKEGEDLLRKGQCEQAHLKLKQSLLGGDTEPLVCFDHKEQVQKDLSQECLDGLIRQGLTDYFSQKYPDAIKQLTEYIDKNGTKSSLALFFRGAAHASLFFLSGEHLERQQEDAVRDFKALPPGFQAPPDAVSPRIQALYDKSLKAR